jgi:predicted RNase H-like HicB family nuclease
MRATSMTFTLVRDAASTCYTQVMNFAIEFDREEDGRWIAEIPSLPGVMAYGTSRADAESKVEAMALRVVADKIERENATMTDLHFAAA